MEGDAGSRRLNPTDADETPDESLAVSQEPFDPQTQEATAEDFPKADSEPGPTELRRPSRLGRGAVAAICAALLVLAGAGAAGGYLALKSNQQSEDSSRAEAAALQAAKDCVAATHAPDTAAMTAAQSKIIECSTGDFGTQASLYASMVAEAYQAADVTVQVSDMRAAVERHNPDGSFEILVAVRVKISNAEIADQDVGYRLRVKMEQADGIYKAARMDQVTSS
jgi:Mce-associated membrane protein